MNGKRNEARLAGFVALALLATTALPAVADDASLRGKLRKLFGRDAAENKHAESGDPRTENREPTLMPKQSSVGRQAGVSGSGLSPRDRQQSPANSQPSSFTLEALEQLTRENNPTLAQASAIVQSALGRQIQAGLYPNPTVGYSGSEIGNDGRGGQQGVVLAQEIVRGGKLQWAQTVAGHEREQAEAQAAAQMLRVLNAVRWLFYETLATQQTLGLTRELVRLAERGVAVAQQREKAGEGTLTETLQAQIELEQVRILETTSVNNYRATWKRLAAIVGRPELEPMPLVGGLETPRDDRDELTAMARIAGQSPEVQIAEAGIGRAEAAVQRARVEPIPNVTLQAGTQYDLGSNTQIANVGVSFPIPVWNKNQGNILAAEYELIRSRREVDRVKLSLAERFAAAYARYRNALQQVERYGQPLPDDEVKRILSLMGEERLRELEKHPQILPRAQLALALATEGWQRGEFNYLQVLTAQRTLTQTTLSYVRAQADLRQTIVALDGYLLTDGLVWSGSSRLGQPGDGSE